MKITKKDILTVNEFADEIGVHRNTVLNMIKNGVIAYFRTGNGKKSAYRIARTEIERMALINLRKCIDKIKDTENI